MLRLGNKSAAYGRCLSTTSRVPFQYRNSILDKYKQETEQIDAPSQLAKESNLPIIEQDLKIKPRQARMKMPLLSDNKVEAPGYQLSTFAKTFGELFVKIFRVDMDVTRSGSVAGSLYFAECKKQGLYYPNEPLSETAKFYYETLNLPQSFSQQVQISLLHYWILSVRMRALPFKYARQYQQKLVDRIFKDLELRMSNELGISSNRIIEGNLKDYHTQLLGSVLSYDEALVSDDITFASALWRNVFNGNPNVDIRHVEALVAYVRSQLYVLNQMTDREFGFGRFKFVPPNEIVKPVTKVQQEQIRQRVKQEFEKMTLPSQKSVLSIDE
ncbi:Protein CBP3 mitochondrial [Spathaspora sp. JA1]|nr:Protein CBP3 mitochondrial [Spathaspora sp. JA1]